MIKVLHIVEAFSGGVLGALQTLVNGMSEDFHSYILYNARQESPLEPQKIFKPEVTLIRAQHLTREIKPKEDFAAMREVRRVFREVNPDVVHLHSTKAGAIGRLALNGKKVPIFYSPQGYSFFMPDCSESKRKMYHLLETMLGYRPSITVASCKGEYDSAKIVSRRATFINNGINTDELDHFGLDFNKRPKEISVCTLGRIVPQKAPEMFNRIAEAFPEVKFVWIGGGELREKLTSPNIEVTGWLTKEAALNKLMESSVFMLTSLYEGLAFSIMESMYLNRLCIVSKIPGNVDAIENGKTGYVCESLDDYIHVIRQLLDNGIDSRMVEAAHARVVKELNQTVMADRYEQLYLKEIEALRG